MFCSYIPASKSTCHISTRLHVNQTCLIIARPTCLYLTHVKYPSNPTTTPRSPEKSCNEVDGHDEAPAQERPGARENLQPTTNQQQEVRYTRLTYTLTDLWYILWLRKHWSTNDVDSNIENLPSKLERPLSWVQSATATLWSWNNLLHKNYRKQLWVLNCDR